MNMKDLTIFGLVLLGIFSRFIPHPPNFTAIGAVALFAGATLTSKRLALALPLVALFLTDLLIGLHNTMIFVYLAFVVVGLLSRAYLKQDQKVAKLLLASLSSSLIFFLITNFGVWVMQSMYSKDFAGLTQCYLMAIPFLETQVLGDLFYSAALFASLEMIRRAWPVKA